MKNLFKDRKTLFLVLGLVMISVFTLTVVYAALSVTLNITGNAQVNAADWDIYLNNPRVTNGSATTNVPVIKTSSTLEFETTLNMPGDFYEFVVDVVNTGDIDAMIENVVKTPDLTTEQAKFLKYEVSYQNGESITTKQLLAKDTTMPIKVRIEYRKDLNNADLPTGQVVLDLSLTLEYIQSDGTGSSVNNNGKVIKVVSGDGTNTSDEVCISEECFYVMYSNEDSVTMLAKYNLYVGYSIDSDWNYTKLTNNIGIQNNKALGGFSGSEYVEPIYDFPWIGVTEFSNNELQGINGSDYNGSLVEEYVNNYNAYLITKGVTPIDTRLITYDELINLGCRGEIDSFDEYVPGSCSDAPNWIYATSYWTKTPEYGVSTSRLYIVDRSSYFSSASYYFQEAFGVRTVIVISKDYF